MNNDNEVYTAIAGLNCWAGYATGFKVDDSSKVKQNECNY